MDTATEEQNTVGEIALHYIRQTFADTTQEYVSNTTGNIECKSVLV